MAQININTEEVRKINGNLESTNADLTNTLDNVTLLLTELSSNIRSENVHPQITKSLNTLEDATSIMKTKLPRLTSFIEGQVGRYVQNEQEAETRLTAVLSKMDELAGKVGVAVAAVAATPDASASTGSGAQGGGQTQAEQIAAKREAIDKEYRDQMAFLQKQYDTGKIKDTFWFTAEHYLDHHADIAMDKWRTDMAKLNEVSETVNWLNS